MNVDQAKEKFKFPKSWKIIPLPELVFYQEGPGVRNYQFTNSGVKLLNVTNLDNNELILSKTDTHISNEQAHGKYKHFLVKEGDLLIASSGINVDQFDQKIAFAKKEHLPLCMNTSTIRFRTLDDNVLDINYFKWFLTTSYFKRQIQFYITGSAQLNFGPSHLEQMFVPIFPVPVQKQIADKLDKADDLRKKRRQAIKLLDEYLRSVFYDMFGDPVKNEKGWEVMKLKEVCINIVDCPHSTPIHVSNKTDYPCIRTSELQDGYINWQSMKYVNKTAYLTRTKRLIPKFGDIIYGREGSFGEAVIVPPNTKICLGQRVMLFRPNEIYVNSKFLWSIVRSQRVYYQAKNKNAGSTVGHVNVKDIINFTIPIPSIELQNKFASIVEQVEKTKAKMRESLNEMDNLFNSLMQKAFKSN